jgi:ADP-ribose pyrophosphatase YjhB (NUDIX family)
MKLWPSKARKSARALVIQDGRLLVMLRKRFSMITGEWIEYYSIPGGGIERGEAPEAAVIRELKEEMGVDIKVIRQVAHRRGRRFEHYIYAAEMVDLLQHPVLMPDSEEALDWHTETNQFIPMWVDVSQLTEENLRYYSDYLELIQAIAKGQYPQKVLDIDAR